MRIITGKENIRQNLSSIFQDESQYSSGIPEKVFFPESVSDLQFVLKEANSKDISVVFIGAQTGTTGGAVPTEDCIAICFSSMNRINSIRWHGDTPVLYCDPGVTLLSINQFFSHPGVGLIT
jgi:FAD/FMN-containing dehydrogenase